jgi:DNA-binding winged helix-turn-helix (wHTH) protein
LAIYRFERFTLDLAKGCLFLGSDEVRLRPKPFEALRYIVERSGRIVSKDELTSAVWSDSFVSDNSLSQVFLEIRKALQDDDQRIIKTVSRRGYLFNVPVERVLAHPVQPDVTPVSTNDKPVPVVSSVRLPTRGFKWFAGGAALLAVLIAAVFWFIASRTATPGSPVSMAVLPFQSLVQSEPDEFLEMGMADALITPEATHCSAD